MHRYIFELHVSCHIRLLTLLSAFQFVREDRTSLRGDDESHPSLLCAGILRFHHHHSLVESIRQHSMAGQVRSDTVNWCIYTSICIRHHDISTGRLVSDCKYSESYTVYGSSRIARHTCTKLKTLFIELLQSYDVCEHTGRRC